MSEIINIAEKLCEELAEYNAELLFVPEFELHELEEMKIVVVPIAAEFKSLSRASHEELLKVQIGILKRCTEDDVSELLDFSQDLGLSFLNKKIDKATCLSVTFNPIYSAEHLRERNQFTSVIELSFKLVK